ncbi:MAG: VCBS repeat-containing protein [Oscillospiraceae bacterium]|nr:VCBS repeat-containing protein [Oscillospiraceae bacterium]
MKTKAILLSLFALLTLTGCFRTAADELYYLPRASDEFIKLQTKIDGVIAAGAEYSPPAGGENRQSVQLVDIDGDGVKEAVAFFMVSAEDHPVKIYIFRVAGDDYEVADIIEGVGSGIESIRYIDMDGDGTTELLVGWQMGAALRHMTLYSERGFKHMNIAEADYSTLTVSDMSGDGLPDVAASRIGTSDAPGEINVFTLMPDGEVASATAYFSDGIESISRIATGKLRDGKAALFLDGKLTGGGIITDIFCFTGKTLSNITRVSGMRDSRLMSVYSTDITGDGFIETPRTIALPQQSDTTYYAIDWFDYSSDGTSSLVISTYHNYSDNWYFILSQSWRGKLTVRREDLVYGERAFVFSLTDARGMDYVHDFLTVFTLSGDNREERSRLQGRFPVLEEGDIIYAAQILNADDNQTPKLTREAVIASFRRIYSDWITGN